MSGLEKASVPLASGLWAAALTDAKFDRNKKRECVTAAQLQVAGKKLRRQHLIVEGAKWKSIRS